MPKIITHPHKHPPPNQTTTTTTTTTKTHNNPEIKHSQADVEEELQQCYTETNR